jgi:hypothetical protein
MPTISDLVRPQPQGMALADLVPRIPWQDMFARVAGYTPASVGIDNEDDAQQHLLALRALQTARSGALPPTNPDSADLNVGRVGQGTGTRPTR